LEQDSIEWIRTATSLERRGYDKREVERFLNKIADWLDTGGGDQARSDIVKRELERVGQRTAGILATAEDSAEQIRADAERAAAETIERGRAEVARSRKAAQEYSEQIRDDADRYAEETRKAADQHARGLVAEAESKAEQVVADGIARRRETEAVISDLVARRGTVIEEANRPADELAAVSARHAPADGEDPFSDPREYDEAARVEA
jgi:cell division septum initiation protein DivIVA